MHPSLFFFLCSTPPHWLTQVGKDGRLGSLEPSQASGLCVAEPQKDALI